MRERKFGFLAGLGFQKWRAEGVLSCLRDLGYTGVSWSFSWFDPRQRPADALPRCSYSDTHADPACGNPDSHSYAATSATRLAAGLAGMTRMLHRAT